MISVLTPVYNRAHLIDKLFQSLLSQSCHDFEWIVVDDGSNDNLREYIKRKQTDKDVFFDIKYYYQENGGKHRALNFGTGFAKGEYTFIVDSDDYLTDNAIENIEEWIRDIKESDSIAAVSGNRGRITESGLTLIGDFPKGRDSIDATNLERIKKHLMGDKAEVYKTEILQRYPFPEFEGEKMIPESVVWNRIALDGYKVRWFNKVIYICEYLPDGLTMMGLENRIQKNINGYICDSKITAKNLPFPYNYINLGGVISVCVKQKMSLEEIKTKMEIRLSGILLGLLFYKLAQFRNTIKVWLKK